MSVLKRKPEIVVFAGPNGSGKSTFTELLKPPMDYINADEIKKNLICDVCHIYDNSCDKPFRIFKKRKDELYYDECSDWHYDDIQALTQLENMKKSV